MERPAVIMVTSNGVGAGHLIRASAIARRLNENSRPIILSMAYSVIEVSKALGIECEFVPGRDKGLMVRRKWDNYLRDRLVALIDETSAKVVTFDGVVPYPGIIAAKFRRPDVSFIWIRRGMWQKKPQGIALSLQSKLMDYVIEPGDVAREYDTGPTKERNEAVVTSPVSLYDPEKTLSKKDALRTLGLEKNRTTVLVQLGVGERDLDERVSAVLKGLSNWSDLQIVMAKEPKNQRGESLIPKGVEVQVIRHFPLADVIHAFDAIVCAAGYNSVHEVIPAKIPTLLIANNRGTDDQLARARWCEDYKLTLFANNESLAEIEQKAKELIEPENLLRLTQMCQRMPNFSGDKDIAAMISMLTNASVSSLIFKRMRYQRFIAQSELERGIGHVIRRFANSILRSAALAFRTLFPHKEQVTPESEVTFSDSLDEKFCAPRIRGNTRFEHLLAGSSDAYFKTRIQIALKAYEANRDSLIRHDSSGTLGSIAFSSATILR
jgi:UDP-N-acetylglucosamine:LPS N-acetylglucosamine transferase